MKKYPFSFYNPLLHNLMQPLSTLPKRFASVRAKETLRLFDLISDKPDAIDVDVISEAGETVGYISAETLVQALSRALRECFAFYEGVLHTVDDSLTIVDAEGNVIGWNKQAEAMYRIPSEDILHHHITRHFKKDAIMLLKSIRDGSSISRHYNQPREGAHVLINTSPVILSGRIIGGISAEKDISDVVRLHDQLSSTTAHLHNLETERYAEQQEDPFYKIKGRSTAITHAIELARKVAHTDATLLITGESGVGKELFAEAVHRASPRKEGPFVALNCGAIPAALFESELFGYEKGAFTGAVHEGKKGKIDMAAGGTLFLDEIGELPLDQQVKLLRVLQERQFYRVGGHKPIPTNVRIVAATNRNLEEMVEAGQFRQDLFYRLNVISVAIPPLRERKEDIPELAQLFLKEFAVKYGKPFPELAPKTIVLLLEYAWPGNIRQLRNLMERLVILTDQKRIEPEHLPEGFLPSQTPLVPQASLPRKITGRNEYEELVEALRTTYGNKSAAAQLLGISRVTLYNRMKKYNIQIE
ncbi:sigma 54-interacting transcriptional regulator [Aneurinibacillus thermoaerophilus]|uniref:Transcriptional regulator containing PAS, AAA-type ATPase, and DNA-binding Fis domains n=1 Tax=Aneurinibacillus thermoaerophilus TaxID=143495 RepID=A0A1G7XA99_ANETH|nr:MULTISPECIES: sigma 54-interacting transcriptional regulator [Aneurinibacillus]MED0674283.1 sigma 54-interacting transcriptional regulator [Aneurinibacillus thermoaerophilus]MED0757019.1 sigma 54-interacting transcriptional regulator [Aneurinibacillus thermoaerophilus]MED0761676.1 sigma 54-interacting transcriptional regulator [Aneurinibacillus thermoaerophilus]SDG81096.1 Transcriptional regulator containing PAS, AAA-type ATPase, and DNA-binding Fis domains [Aneurinibacillus thermoaerophilus